MAKVVRFSLEIEHTLLDIGLHLNGAKNALMRSLRRLEDTLEVIQMSEAETAKLRKQAKCRNGRGRSDGASGKAVGQTCFERGHFGAQFATQLREI